MASLFCFAMACDLREDTPQQVIDTLKYMTRSQDYEFDNPPDAAFFEDDDWRTFLTCDKEGFMFPGKPTSPFTLPIVIRAQYIREAMVYMFTR